MDDLIVAALQEGRIDRAERPVAFGRQAGRERHRMLLGDADVEDAVGKLALHPIEPGPVGHGGGNGDDLLVPARFVDQRVGENPGVGGRVGLWLGLGAGNDVERGDAMILVVGGLGRGIALALLGHHVHEHRTALHVAHILQDRQQMVEIVAVDRPDVIEAELLEQGAAGPEAAAVFLGAPRLVVEELRQPARELLGGVAQRAIGLAGDEAGEIGRHRAGRRRDRHVVVVEDDDQPRAESAGVVHRFVGHPRRHRAVADDRDNMIASVRQVARDRHAEAGGDRRRGMGRAERIVFAFRALGETGEAAALTQSSDPVAPSGQDLVRIGLMADVPDDAIGRRIEHVVERHSQLDHAETGAEMPARHRHRADCLGAQFVGDLSEVVLVKLAQIGRRVDLIQQGRERFRHFIPKGAAPFASIWPQRRRPTPSQRFAAIAPGASTRQNAGPGRPFPAPATGSPSAYPGATVLSRLVEPRRRPRQGRRRSLGPYVTDQMAGLDPPSGNPGLACLVEVLRRPDRRAPPLSGRPQGEGGECPRPAMYSPGRGRSS